VTAKTLAAALLADRDRVRTPHNIVAYFSCGRTYLTRAGRAAWPALTLGVRRAGVTVALIDVGAGVCNGRVRRLNHEANRSKNCSYSRLGGAC
jgi:hypothetical protein